MAIKKATIVETCCTLLVLLFLYTASSKLLNLRQTYHEMNIQPFPNWMTPYLVWGISIMEFCAAVLLIFNRTKKTGLWTSLILMIGFTIYIAAILLDFFDKVPCSCGGVIAQLGWQNHLYFNMFFVAVSIIGIILSRKKDNSPEMQKVVFT